MDKTKDLEQSAIDMAILGDERGYRYLLEKYKSFAFSVAIQIVRKKENAEEVVQDSFIKAFKSISKFKNIGKFSTWLYKIVYNTSLTSIRGHKLYLDSVDQYEERAFEIPDNCKDGFDQLLDKDREHFIQIAISKLSETERLTATLYYVNQSTISEIEQITGWKTSTIKSRLFRGRQKLYYELSRILKSELKDLK